MSLPHSGIEVYRVAVDLMVRADELAEQLPTGERIRGEGIKAAAKQVAVAVACMLVKDTEADEVRAAVAEALVEADLFERRAFVVGIDELRGMLADILGRV